MVVFHCPECGNPCMDALHVVGFFRCHDCQSSWLIQRAAPPKVSGHTPALYGALGNFETGDSIATAKLNTIDKGVSL
jgi:hypothetical protein